MSPKDYADPEHEPQTPEEVDEASEDDTTGIQNHEQDEDREGTESKPMTMEERQAKMQKLRAKMVRPYPVLSPRSHKLFVPSLRLRLTAVVCARESRLGDRRIREVQKHRP
jgi:hypothetical protein